MAEEVPETRHDEDFTLLSIHGWFNLLTRDP